MNEFWEMYGTQILEAIGSLVSVLITGICGFIGYKAKQYFETKTLAENDKIKQEIAETVVKSVEQVYNDVSGAEKLDRAIDGITNMLGTRNIDCSEFEARVLIESAVGKFNDIFAKAKNKEE